MLEFIQVTAQYSNAVLVAILPQVSDFVKKAELPMSTPVILEQVREFKCFPVKNDAGGLIILTNGLRVWYHHGYVNGFRTPRSYYNLQDPREIPRYYGALKFNKAEAIQFARGVIRKLGYSLKETFADQEPTIDLPIQIGTNVVPFYRFQWGDPVFGRTAVTAEIDAGQSRMIMQEMQFFSPFFWHAQPRIAIQPELRTPRAEISVTASNQFLAETLPKIGEFAKRLGLPLNARPTARDLERIEFFNGLSGAWLKFSNGYVFSYDGGGVTHFSSPDSIYGVRVPEEGPPPIPFESYLGKWKMNQQEATELVRRAITSLGYTPKDFNVDAAPDITTNKSVGKYIVPRYRLYWITNNPSTGETISLVSAEVNADKKRLEYLRLFGRSLIPATENVRTNTPSASNTPTNSSPDPLLDPQFLKWMEGFLGESRTNANRTNPPMPKPSPFE